MSRVEAAAVRLMVSIQQHHPDMAAFVVVPAAKIARWKLTATTTVEGTIDRVPLGRRSLLRGDGGSWFVELRREHLARLGKVPGDRAMLTLGLASAELPEELKRLVDGNAAARARWEAHTDAQKRMLRELVLQARTAAARERRARRALFPVAKPAPPQVEGLAAAPRDVLVRIIGRKLPGLSCGPYTEIGVGLPQKVGCDPEEVVPADARGATWETTIQVREKDGAPAFRGPAVNGPPDERFLYLTWIGRLGR